MVPSCTKSRVALNLSNTFFCFLLLFSVGVAHAQDSFEAAQRAAMTQNPADLTFALRTSDQRTEFHMGEIIRLTLDFAAVKPGQYQLNPMVNPGMLMETFHVSPSAGVANPRAGLLQTVMINGYVPPPIPLTAQPSSITLTLNEQVRFDKPGVYRLYATSNRVTDARASSQQIFFGAERSVVSNTISLTILPQDPAWAHAQVQSALTHLPDSLYVLRFLDTPESARALLSILATDRFPRSSQSNDWNCRLGLVAYPDRKWLIREMERDLAAPNYTLTQTFLSTLVWLASQQHDASDAGPLARSYWNQAADAASQKTGAALPMTLYSLLDTACGDARIGNDAHVQARLPRMTRRMATVFDRLPPLPQEYLLDNDWHWMRTRLLLPSLRRLWAAAINPGNVGPGLNELILRRLYDLSPVEGRALILKEAAALQPRASIDALGILPDRTLPGLDKILAANLTNRQADLDTTCALIARYASPALFPIARGYYGDAQGWACVPKVALLAYFLRVKPPVGAALVRQALTQRKQTGCYTMLFTDVAALRYDANLEKVAVAHLNDPDPEVVADAAEALGKYGTHQCESALRARLRRKDRPGPRDRFEWRLVEALATGQNWYESQSRLRQIRALCATESGRQQVDQYVSENPTPSISMDYDFFSDIRRWRIGWYTGTSYTTFTAKMAQFPRGTVFSWQDLGVGAEEEHLFIQSQRFAQTHGTIVKRWRPK